MIPLLADSEEELGSKIYYYFVIFDIYVYSKDKLKAEAILNIVQTYSDKIDIKERISGMEKILQGEFVG